MLATAATFLLTLLIATGVSVSYAIQAETARKQADTQKDAAIASQKDADQQREDALAARIREEKNFRQARETVDTYLTKVSEDVLLDQPAMQPLRKDLLKLALDYYQGFVEQQPNDTESQSELAAAYHRLASINMELGNFSAALDLAQQGLENRQQLTELEPNNLERQFDLSQSYHDVSRCYSGAMERENAVKFENRAISILEGIAEDQSADPKFHFALAEAYIGRGSSPEHSLSPTSW